MWQRTRHETNQHNQENQTRVFTIGNSKYQQYISGYCSSFMIDTSSTTGTLLQCMLKELFGSSHRCCRCRTKTSDFILGQRDRDQRYSKPIWVANPLHHLIWLYSMSSPKLEMKTKVCSNMKKLKLSNLVCSFTLTVCIIPILYQEQISSL